MLRRILAVSALYVLVSSTALARGPSPYLPQNLDPEAERDVERVLMLAGVALLTRPIPAAVVLEALPRACRVDALLCQRAGGILARYTNKLSVTHAALAGAAAGSADTVIPNRHGLRSDSAWEVSARAQWQPFDHAIVSAGGIAFDGDVTPIGSVLSVGWSKFQVDVGWRDHWLSPLTDSALLLSTEAPTMPSVTISNYEPLTRFGFRYAVFAARMSHSDSILDEGGLTSGNPGLFGVHLSAEPTPGWSIGASRIMQFGGGSRPSSFKELVKAFFDPAGRDNVLPGGGTTEQLGNQLASITSRFVFPGSVPFAVYVEHGGEDTLSRENYLLGNAATSFGIDFPSLFERFDLTYEVSEWQNAWYVHPLYGDGLSNEGRIVGHWGGDRRRKGDPVGAQTHMLRVGWRPAFGGAFQLRYRTIENESYSSITYERGHDFSLRYMRPWRELSLGAEVQAGRDTDGKTFSRLVALVQYSPSREALGPADAASGAAEEKQKRPRGAELFVDAGATLSRVWIDLDRNLPLRKTNWAPGLHLAVGARRAISARQDLGVRLELDEVDAGWLVGVRLLDYRVRIGRHLAVSGFFGAARWALATPAYGIYVGAGAQWRDLLPSWHVGLDARYAPNIARDDLVPQDPIGNRISSYRELLGFSLYLSRGF